METNLNAIAKLLQYMEKCGLPCNEELNLDGGIHRYGKGGAQDDKAEWYTGYDFPWGGVYCTFGTWGGEQQQYTFRSWEDNNPYAERYEEEARKIREAAIERQKSEALIARRKYQKLWEESPPADNGHPYLSRKKVKAHKGVRLMGDVLLIPRFDANKEFSSVQRISPEGHKKNAPNLPCKSTFYIIGEKESPRTIRLCEGYATASTIHEITGDMTVCCFSMGNIIPVTFIMRELFPTSNLILDADTNTEKLCKEWKQIYRGIVQAPKDLRGSDFNDLFIECGRDTCYTQLRFKKRELCNAEKLLTEELPVRDIILSTFDGLHETGDERESEVHPIIHKGTSTLVYAGGGVGKTTFLYEFAVALSTGKRFLNYTIKRPWSVLYIDAEMGANAIQSRLKEVVERRGVKDYGDLKIYSPAREALMTGKYSPINLNDPEDRLAFEELFEDSEVIFIDNIQNVTLEVEGSESYGARWQEIFSWMREWMMKGKTFIIASHETKSGGQYRGSVRQGGDFDNIIHLKRPDEIPASGFALLYEFVKGREMLQQLLYTPFIAHRDESNTTLYKWRVTKAVEGGYNPKLDKKYLV